MWRNVPEDVLMLSEVFGLSVVLEIPFQKDWRGLTSPSVVSELSAAAGAVPPAPPLRQRQGLARELVEAAQPAADTGRVPQRSLWLEQVCNHVCAYPEGTCWCETAPQRFPSHLQLSRMVYLLQGRNWLLKAGSDSNPSLLLQSSEDLNLQKPPRR